MDDLQKIKYQLFTGAGQPVPPSSRSRLEAAAQLLEVAERGGGLDVRDGKGGDQDTPERQREAGPEGDSEPEADPMELSQQVSQESMDMSQKPNRPHHSTGAAPVPRRPASLHTLDGPKTAFVAPSMVDKVLKEHGQAVSAPKRRGRDGGGGDNRSGPVVRPSRSAG
ncbi:hypothetical protein GPECTOR_2g1309 [Gonium pectorale]|uniref:Uncharacterized protein n=1 Tax=Gonium pectorale TaxID=33097 RepID=A0A150H0V9_GONPE|nr:hypothetical protein GPECTOR_2g1309 [Gonium pectorale]|eukprot:KXZ55759.1 hypothetical protein GPECTOR_2g1309 [Gonium pectorale]